MLSPESGRTDLPIVLITGASGYVGDQLIPLHEIQSVNLRDQR